MIYKFLFILLMNLSLVAQVKNELTPVSEKPNEIDNLDNTKTIAEKSQNLAERRINRRHQIAMSYIVFEKPIRFSYQYNFSKFVAFAVNGQSYQEENREFYPAIILSSTSEIKTRKSLYYADFKVFPFESFPMFLYFGGGYTKKYGNSSESLLSVNNFLNPEMNINIFIYSRNSYTDSKLATYGLGFQHLFQNGFLIGFGFTYITLLDRERNTFVYSNSSIKDFNLLINSSYLLNNKVENNIKEITFSIGYTF
jgi:hypothetical protein